MAATTRRWDDRGLSVPERTDSQRGCERTRGPSTSPSTDSSDRSRFYTSVFKMNPTVGGVPTSRIAPSVVGAASSEPRKSSIKRFWMAATLARLHRGKERPRRRGRATRLTSRRYSHEVGESASTEEAIAIHAGLG